MKRTTPIALGLAALMTFTQAAPASAHGWDAGGRGSWHGGGGHRGHGDGGLVLGLFALGAAVVVGTAELVTAPVRAIADAPYDSGPGYAQAPQQQYYAQQQPQAYYPPQYQQPQVVYYNAPPQYYAAPPAYYGRPYYGR